MREIGRRLQSGLRPGLQFRHVTDAALGLREQRLRRARTPGSPTLRRAGTASACRYSVILVSRLGTTSGRYCIARATALSSALAGRRKVQAGELERRTVLLRKQEGGGADIAQEGRRGLLAKARLIGLPAEAPQHQLVVLDVPDVVGLARSCPACSCSLAMRRMVSSGTASSRPMPTIAGATRGEIMASLPSSPNRSVLELDVRHAQRDRLAVGEAHLARGVGENRLPFRRHAVLDAAVLQLIAVRGMGQRAAFAGLARDAQAHQHALRRRLSVRRVRAARPLFTWQWAQRSSLKVGPSPHTPEGSGATTQASLNCSLPLANASRLLGVEHRDGNGEGRGPRLGRGEDTGGERRRIQRLVVRPRRPVQWRSRRRCAAQRARPSRRRDGRSRFRRLRPSRSRAQCRSHGLCLTSSGSQMVS